MSEVISTVVSVEFEGGAVTQVASHYNTGTRLTRYRVNLFSPSGELDHTKFIRGAKLVELIDALDDDCNESRGKLIEINDSEIARIRRG